MKQAFVTFCALSAALLLHANCVSAQPQVISSPPPPADEWSFRLAPYVWATTLNGKAGVKGIEADVDVQPHELLDNTDGALMLVFEVRKGKLAFINDLLWLHISDEAATPRGIAFSEAEYKLEQFVYSGYASYTVFQNERITFELLAGARLQYMDAELNIEGNAAESRGVDQDKTWADPLIGMRAFIPLTDAFAARFLGDIGGFGVASDLTWQVFAGFSYALNESSGLLAGYRTMGYDYQDGGFTYDLDTYGPALGGEFRF